MGDVARWLAGNEHPADLPTLAEVEAAGYHVLPRHGDPPASKPGDDCPTCGAAWYWAAHHPDHETPTPPERP